jgi:hypothetical protein
MAMWIDYGMFGFTINSNIKSKYQWSHRIAVRLTDLLSNKQRSDNLSAILSEHGMFWFCLKYGYNHQVSTFPEVLIFQWNLPLAYWLEPNA